MFSYSSWNNVLLSKSSGSPNNGSTIKSLVLLQLAFDGDIKNSFGFIIVTFSLYKALNKILKDSSVPLVPYKSLVCLRNCSLNSGVNSLPSKPGANCFLIFFKNSSKNKILKFCTLSPCLCGSATVLENNKFSGSSLFSYEETPLKPLLQLKKFEEFFDSYVIISFPIFNNPKVSGNPVVPNSLLAKFLEVCIVVSVSDISVARTDSFAYLPFLNKLASPNSDILIY